MREHKTSRPYAFWRGLLLWMIFTIQAQAAILVEVFTSSNCDICDEAEQAVLELGQKDDIFVAAYHLDYWDYLGEKDPFADPVYGARQAGYNMGGAIKGLHIPQIIIQGEQSVSFTDRPAMSKIINTYLEEMPIDAEMEKRDGTISLSLFLKDEQYIKTKDVVLVKFYSDHEVAELFEADNPHIPVVKSLTRLTSWEGNEPLHIEFDAFEDEMAYIFVQLQDFGKILYVNEF